MRSVPGLCLVPAPPGVVAILHQAEVVLRIILASSAEEVLRRFPDAPRTRPVLLVRAVKDYLEGHSHRFDLPYRLEGITPFRRLVLEEVRRIPYGRTVSYAEVARRIGKPAACRAVGQALAANPLPLIIPCHRVVQSDGSPGGFMADAEDRCGWKAFLLGLERRHPAAEKA